MSGVKKLEKHKQSETQVVNCVSSVNVQTLSEELKYHPDKSFCDYLLKGFIEGFDTGLTKLPELPWECDNLLSAKRQPDITSELLETELDRGYVVGPFDTIPFHNYRISPIGVAESKYSKKKRLIVDLSAPHDNPDHPNLNELIKKEDYSLEYFTIDMAISIIKRLGKGAWLTKTDIKDAFKLVPIKKSLFPFYGVKWNNKYYFYTRLVFGSRSSPKIFDTLSQTVCWILENNYGIRHILHLLDDFLAVDAPNAEADRTMAIFSLVFNKLGIPLSLNKTVGPVTELVGVILDTLKMEARLPVDKIERIHQLLLTFLNRKSCTKQELLSLLGHLNFAARVIYPGRAFVSYLISLSTTVKSLFHHVKLTAECRLDIRMWTLFLEQWNGVSFFLNDEEINADDLQFFTDATPTGYGGFFQGKWFAGKFEDNLVPADTKASMALFELYLIVLAAVLWGHMWSRKRIVVNCDNASVVDIINRGRSKIPFIMKFVRKLIWLEAQYSFVIRARHISGVSNSIADSLSRFQFQKFHRLAKADRLPVKCPPASDLMLF